MKKYLSIEYIVVEKVGYLFEGQSNENFKVVGTEILTNAPTDFEKLIVHKIYISMMIQFMIFFNIIKESVLRLCPQN